MFVFDVTGKIILTLQSNALTNSEAEISLEKASVGVYFVKISNENSQIVKRIIKK